MGVLCVFASLYVSTDAYSYGLTRFGHYGYPRSSSYVYNSLNWPGVKGPGFESTCWGCRGKRSADADSDASAEAEPGISDSGTLATGMLATDMVFLVSDGDTVFQLLDIARTVGSHIRTDLLRD